MTLKWFLSRKVRRASEMRRHVNKFVNHQRDLLSDEAVAELQEAMVQVDETIARGGESEALQKSMDHLETVANKRLKPYPNASIRENIEVFLVAIAVAVGIRTFFLQPFKIPTGSMQPTLYGITPPPPWQGGPGIEPDLEIPNRLVRLFHYWAYGISYFHETAQASGQLREIKEPVRFLLFNLKQDYRIGNEWQTVWFPDDSLFQRAGLYSELGIASTYFNEGDTVMKLRVKSGDHLFVDRLSFNFRAPERGEIIVFSTKGTDIEQQDQFYIKRLIAFGGEDVRIGNDNHVVIDGKRLDASTPRFENVYTFDKDNPQVSEYYGHVNNKTAYELFGSGRLAPKFPDGESVYTVPENSYIAFGDNTLSSSDSRVWGEIPRENVIGKSFFVYWPISKRFGWSHLVGQ